MLPLSCISDNDFVCSHDIYENNPNTQWSDRME